MNNDNKPPSLTKQETILSHLEWPNANSKKTYIAIYKGRVYIINHTQGGYNQFYEALILRNC